MRRETPAFLESDHMNGLFALQSKMFGLMLNQSQNSLAAWTTIAMRMPDLAAEGLAGRPPSAETRRMVQEKLNAAAQGAMNGAMESARLATRMMGGRMDAAGLASGMLDVANAAGLPAQRKVRANAKRLTRSRG